MAEMDLQPQIEASSDSETEDFSFGKKDSRSSQSTSSEGLSSTVGFENSTVADASTSFGPIITSSPVKVGETLKRSFDDADDLIIVEDLLQFMIAKVAGAPIKTEMDWFDSHTDSGVIVISDDE